MTYLVDQIIQLLQNGLDKKDVQYYYFGMPYSLPEAITDKGVVVVEPVSNSVSSVTTGITDEETPTIRIVLIKGVKQDFNRNAQKETGAAYLTRIMEGRDASNKLLTNTIRYIIRKNIRNLGLLQPGFNIDYKTQEDLDTKIDTVMATLTLSILDHQTQDIF